ncbi:MAG: ATP-binding protein [Solirubrobacterales bacterium]|nr:ATP-binding protein [Solirubrobacterales bacterium]
MSLTESRTLSESYPAVPLSIPRARNRLVRFAAAAGAQADQLESIRLAASEALTNVVLHAYRAGAQGRIDVVAAVASGELWLLVADDGTGLRPRPDSPGLGMGLALIAGISDGMEVVRRASGGTEVRMRFSLRATEPPPDHSRGSDDSASSPASSHFSTTL